MMLASALVEFLQSMIEKHGDQAVGFYGDDQVEDISCVALAAGDADSPPAFVLGGDRLHDDVAAAGAPQLGEFSG
jgi:hypothetical protein